MQDECIPSAPNLNPALPNLNFAVRDPAAWYELAAESLVPAGLKHRPPTSHLRIFAPRPPRPYPRSQSEPRD